MTLIALLMTLSEGKALFSCFEHGNQFQGTVVSWDRARRRLWKLPEGDKDDDLFFLFLFALAINLALKKKLLWNMNGLITVLNISPKSMSTQFSKKKNKKQIL